MLAHLRLLSAPPHPNPTPHPSIVAQTTGQRYPFILRGEERHLACMVSIGQPCELKDNWSPGPGFSKYD